MRFGAIDAFAVREPGIRESGRRRLPSASAMPAATPRPPSGEAPSLQRPRPAVPIAPPPPPAPPAPPQRQTYQAEPRTRPHLDQALGFEPLSPPARPNTAPGPPSPPTDPLHVARPAPAASEDLEPTRVGRDTQPGVIPTVLQQPKDEEEHLDPNAPPVLAARQDVRSTSPYATEMAASEFADAPPVGGPEATRQIAASYEANEDDTEADIFAAFDAQREAADEGLDAPALELATSEWSRVALVPHAFRRRTEARGTGALKPLAIVVLILLFEAAALPSLRGGELVPPWELLLSPGSTTFVATCFFVLLLLALSLRLDAITRAGLVSAVGAGVLVFGSFIGASAVGAGAFDGQPAISMLLAGPAGPRILVLIAAIGLPLALFWRRQDPHSVGARIVIGTSMALVLVIYFGLHSLGAGSSAPVSALIDSAGNSPFMGDRIGAVLALLPLAATLLAALAFMPAPSKGLARLSALLIWGALFASMVVVALFVATSDEWMRVLEPLKVVTVIGAGLLLLPIGTGTLLALLGGEQDA